MVPPRGHVHYLHPYPARSREARPRGRVADLLAVLTTDSTHSDPPPIHLVSQEPFSCPG